MRLLSLSVERFRNLSSVQLEPSKGATVLVGQNGQGKTNLLEAIYYLMTLKALRGSRLSELIQFQQPDAVVTGCFELGGAQRTISVRISEAKRHVSIDGKKTSRVEDYFGGVSVVAFTPDDLDVIKGSPEGRRQFLDRAVFNRWPAYLKEGRAFQRALRSRNRLLKERAPHPVIEAFDLSLAKAGARIWTRRRALLKEVAGRAAGAFREIGRVPAPANFSYRPISLDSSVNFEEASESELFEALQRALTQLRLRDLERGHTSVGPQADDLIIKLGEQAARAFASQGQQRALVLAWKIAEIQNLNDVLGYLPLLLLDDVSSELDPQRNAYLMDLLASSGAQVLLSTTDAKLVRRAADDDTRWFEMKGGGVARMPSPVRV